MCSSIIKLCSEHWLLSPGRTLIQPRMLTRVCSVESVDDCNPIEPYGILQPEAATADGKPRLSGAPLRVSGSADMARVWVGCSCMGLPLQPGQWRILMSTW